MTDALDSLPDRPLRAVELAALNRSDAFDLVVPVAEEAAVDPEAMEDVVVSEGVLVAADDWVRGLAYDDGWRVVAAETVEGEDRTDALVACEGAVEDALRPGEAV